MEEIRGAPFTWGMTADAGDQRLVVVTDHEGVLVTRDGGCSWRRAVEYTDLLAPFSGSAVDAVVAGAGRDRSLHVLVAPWLAFASNLPAKLLSSYDDGATWTVADAPPLVGPVSALRLSASPAAPGRVYLLVDRLVSTSVYAGSGGSEWRWQSLALPSVEAPCSAGPPCPSRPLRSIHADPAGEDLWGSSFGVGDEDEALAHSGDGGATWRYRSVPVMPGGVSQMVAAPGLIALAGDFWDFALSRDGGVSWSVGTYPKLTSSRSTSVSVFDIAYFDRGLALLPGSGSTSGWAGNVLVFDGRRWTNAAPPAFAGYDRTDGDGDQLSFAGIASTNGPLLALSSSGDLMAFRSRGVSAP